MILDVFMHILNNNTCFENIVEEENLFDFLINGSLENDLQRSYRLRIKYKFYVDEILFFDNDNFFEHDTKNHFNKDGSFCVCLPDKRVQNEEYFLSCLISALKNHLYKFENGVFPTGTELPHNFFAALLIECNTQNKLNRYFKCEQNLTYVKAFLNGENCSASFLKKELLEAEFKKSLVKYLVNKLFESAS